MPFTYVPYNPDSRDNNLCDKRILATTNLETWIKKNKPKKCSVQYVLNCSYRLGRLKRQQASEKLRFLHRSYMRAKQNGGLLREKQARQLSKPLTAQRCSHRWRPNPGTMEPSNQKSQMDQECGLLPADALQQWKRANKQKQQTNGNRSIWLVCRTDTNARGFWLVKRTLGYKNFMPEELSRNQSILGFDGYTTTRLANRTMSFTY